MKRHLIKTISMATLAVTLVSVNPIGANADWKQDSTGWWYTEGNSWATGWRQISGTWYYFDANGYMKTGWVKDNGSWYYMDASGAMKTGWVQDGSSWYFMNKSGVMQTGWVQNSASWYYMDKSGIMQTGWVKDGANWFYMNKSGVMQTGRQEIENSWYHFGPGGYMYVKSMADGYYYGADGSCNTPKATISWEEAGDLVKKNDSEYLKKFESSMNTEVEHSSLLMYIECTLSEYINIGSAGIKDEAAYIYSLSSFSNTSNDSILNCVYIVGANSGNVYALANQGGYKIYQIKDNQIVNTCLAKDAYDGLDWR